jgi:hypothetical protein
MYERVASARASVAFFPFEQRFAVPNVGQPDQGVVDGRGQVMDVKLCRTGQRRWIIGIQGQCMGDRLSCFVFLAESDQGQRSIVMGLDGLLILPERLLGTGQRLVKEPSDSTCGSLSRQMRCC